MTPLDALKLLDSLVAQVPLSRPDHHKVSQAVAVLLSKITEEVK